MIGLVWHVFITVWATGFVVWIVRPFIYNENRRLRASVEQQALRTRIAELQARENRALDVHH